jgi:hypothetical protein
MDAYDPNGNIIRFRVSPELTEDLEAQARRLKVHRNEVAKMALAEGLRVLFAKATNAPAASPLLPPLSDAA